MVTCHKRTDGCADAAIKRYFRYDAFGAVKAFDASGAAITDGSQFLIDRLYTGQRWEWQARVYDYKARFYDPRTARFASHDPAGEGTNPYAYVAWRPLAFTDPLGKNMYPPGFTPAVTPIKGPEMYFDLKGALGGGTANGQQYGLGGLRIGADFSGQSGGSALAGAFSSLVSVLAVALFPVGLAVTALGASTGATYGAISTGTLDGALQGASVGGSYAAAMYMNDVADAVGGVVGHMYGAVTGVAEIARGIGTLEPGHIGKGLFNLFATVAMPRLGSHGGLNWPGTANNNGLIAGSNSTVNLSSIDHDEATGAPGGMLVSANHLGWVAQTYAGDGIQPGLYGSAYRGLGTVGFGIFGGVLRGLGQ
jgi:RHS repeat-associated protein